MHEHEHELEALLARYVAGEASLGEVHSRVQRDTWTDQHASDFAATVRLIIAEATSAERSEALREEFNELLRERNAARQLQQASRDQLVHIHLYRPAQDLMAGSVSGHTSTTYGFDLEPEITPEMEGHSGEYRGDLQPSPVE